MKLTFEYRPVADLAAAVAWHQDVLGLEEAWRADDDTVAMVLPGTDVQLMLGLRLPTHRFEWFAGPMFQVEDVDQWVAEHPEIEVVGPTSHTPPVHVVPCHDPDGNGFYVYELDLVSDG